MKNSFIFILVAFFGITSSLFGQTYTTVSTFAGTGAVGLLNGPALSSKFNFNYGVCSDSAGNIYVADALNHCIRMISGGIVTTVAGNGVSGDVDAQGSNARFNDPTGVYFKNGYLYICDNLNSKIKRMDLSFNVVTIAGTGVQGYLDGPWNSARFYQPKSIVVDNSNNVFVADYENHCIRKISNGIVTTYAGIGGSSGDVLGPAASAKFWRPRDLCVDAIGNVYVADLSNQKVKKISTLGIVSLVAGSGATSSIDGTGPAASFNLPVGIDWGLTGDLFVLDAGSGKIRRLTTSGVVTTVAGSGMTGFVNGPVATARFGSLPQDLAIDPSGNLYIGDRTNNVVRVLTNVSVISAIAATTIPSCFAGNNGTATVTPSGGTAPYTYSWSPYGGTNATATGLSAGTFTCTITDAVGNILQQTVTVTQPSAVSSTMSSSSTACTFNSGTATVNASGGTGPYTYNWLPSGGTGSTATGLGVGTYSCTITDANACMQTDIFNISTTLPPTVTSIIANPTGCIANNGNATVVATGGTGIYSYSWSPSGGTGSVDSGLGTGNYTCTITDSNGCTVTASTSITNSPLPIASVSAFTNVLCNGGNTGTASVNVTSGTPGFTYLWSPTGGTAATGTGLTMGNYICTVTDSQGCVTTQSVTITEPSPLASTLISDTATCGNSNGSAAIVGVTGGVGPYTYLWSTSQTTTTISNLAGGTYSVTITDANGCSLVESINVIAIAAQVVTTQSTVNPFCYGGTSGAASVNVTGGISPFIYSWAPIGGNSAIATNLSAGIYTVTVIGNDGCIQTQLVTLTQPAALQVANTIVPENCSNTDGSASVSITGGTPAYTYLWSTTSTNDTISNLSAGTYSVTVLDANGCSVSTSVNIPSINSVNANAGTSITITLGQNTTLNASGGGTYSWSPSTGLSCSNCQNPTANPSVTTTYTLLVTDANGCQGTDSVTVFVDIPCGEVFVPSAFSPNGDQENDVLYVRGICISSMYFQIYNRWGELVFLTEDNSFGWDGTWRGKPCEAAVFTYVLQATLNDGTIVKKQGNISLVK